MFGPDYDGRFFVLGPRRQLVAELVKPVRAHVELGLEPGEYEVYFEQEQKLLSSSVELRDGERQELGAPGPAPDAAVADAEPGRRRAARARPARRAHARADRVRGVPDLRLLDRHPRLRAHGSRLGGRLRHALGPSGRGPRARPRRHRPHRRIDTRRTDRTSGTFAFLAGARYYPPLSGIVRPYASAAIGPFNDFDVVDGVTGSVGGDHGHALRRYAGRRRGHALRAALHPRPGRAGDPRHRSVVALRRDRDLRVDVRRTAMMVLALAVLASPDGRRPVEATDGRRGPRPRRGRADGGGHRQGHGVDPRVEDRGRHRRRRALRPRRACPRATWRSSSPPSATASCARRCACAEAMPEVEIRVGQEALKRIGGGRGGGAAVRSRRRGRPRRPQPARRRAAQPRRRPHRRSAAVGAVAARRRHRRRLLRVASPRAAPASRPSASTWTAC